MQGPLFSLEIRPGVQTALGAGFSFQRPNGPNAGASCQPCRRALRSYPASRSNTRCSPGGRSTRPPNAGASPSLSRALRSARRPKRGDRRRDSRSHRPMQGRYANLVPPSGPPAGVRSADNERDSRCPRPNAGRLRQPCPRLGVRSGVQERGDNGGILVRCGRSNAEASSHPCPVP